MLTLGAAGATLLVVLAVVGIPVVDACRGDTRGLLGCLRGVVNDRFDLRAQPDLAPPAVVVTPEAATVTEPSVVAALAPEVQIDAPAPPLLPADAPAVPSMPEPTRSLAPPAADNPATPAEAPPQLAVAPPSEVAPVEIGTPAVGAEPETIALAALVEPEPPSFVPPSPAITIAGVPPDLQVAAASPEPTPAPEPAPSFVLSVSPELPTAPPPDLVAALETTDAPELPAPVTPDAPVMPLPAAEPAPDFVLSATPELPTSPPPDLTIAAIDPVIPDAPAPPLAPLFAPTIDAVEIDGVGSSIAGKGPAGATMRLYVDGIPAGVSPVEGGRWLVEGTELLTEPKQTLKVEALDALSGKVIGEATVEFERPVEPVAVTPAPSAAEPDDFSWMPQDERPDPLTPAVDVAAPTVAADAALEAPAVAETPAVIELPQVAVEADQPAPVPPIPQMIPAGETASVIILKRTAEPSFATLRTGEPSDEALITLGATP